jgi:hypothetical protein
MNGVKNLQGCIGRTTKITISAKQTEITINYDWL